MLSVLAACLASTAAAADDDPAPLERVEVTGSRIPRIGGETALPVQVITREDIERSGAQTLEDVLPQITASFGSQKLSESIGDDNRSGYSGVSLRGLGEQETLVLIDGRRLANYAFSDQNGVGVDLNAIPLDAVERIEILKDGASAIYGTDAIGGVVNFILRKDYRGASVAFYRGNSEHGGGGGTRATGTFGFGDLAADRYNVFATFDYLDEARLRAIDRPFSQTAYQPQNHFDGTSTDTFPANIALGNNLYANPAAPACTAQTVFKAGGCAYDDAKIIDLIPPAKHWTGLVAATVQWAPDQQLYAQASYARNRAKYTIAASPVDANVTVDGNPITLPASSPFYPQGLGLTGTLGDLHYRTVPLGPRVDMSDSENDRGLVGAKGTVLGWEYDSAFVFNRSKAISRYLGGNVGGQAISDALASGLVNPFGDSGPVGDALLASTELTGLARSASGITRGVDFRLNRELIALPAGPLAIALGGEARRETLTDESEAIASEIVGGDARAGSHGQRSVEAVFVELGVPIARGLDAQLAVRGDHYSDFGTTFNPKVSLRWEPVKSVLLRGSYGRGFRAPSLPELFTTQSSYFSQLPYGGDRVRCPVTGDDGDCGDNVVKNTFGGNPALKPEKSEQATAGVVLQPTRTLLFSVDWWKIRIANVIAPLDAGTALANDATFEGTNIIRGPVDPAYPTLPGPITSILVINENVGTYKTHGLDVTLAYRSDPLSIGRLTAKLDGTVVQQSAVQIGTPLYVNNRANYGAGFVAPRWQHYLSFGWEAGPFTSTIAQTFSTGYTEYYLDSAYNAYPHHVSSYESWDAQVAYGGVKDLKLSVGVRNLTDRRPPFTVQGDFFQIGYNPAVADPQGRFWYGKLTYRFL